MRALTTMGAGVALVAGMFRPAGSFASEPRLFRPSGNTPRHHARREPQTPADHARVARAAAKRARKAAARRRRADHMQHPADARFTPVRRRDLARGAPEVTGHV